jgi:hypothetical protein
VFLFYGQDATEEFPAFIGGVGARRLCRRHERDYDAAVLEWSLFVAVRNAKGMVFGLRLGDSTGPRAAIRISNEPIGI